MKRELRHEGVRARRKGMKYAKEQGKALGRNLINNPSQWRSHVKGAGTDAGNALKKYAKGRALARLR